jgi:hypothetical protein
MRAVNLDSPSMDTIKLNFIESGGTVGGALDIADSPIPEKGGRFADAPERISSVTARCWRWDGKAKRLSVAGTQIERKQAWRRGGFFILAVL